MAYGGNRVNCCDYNTFTNSVKLRVVCFISDCPQSFVWRTVCRHSIDIWMRPLPFDAQSCFGCLRSRFVLCIIVFVIACGALIPRSQLFSSMRPLEHSSPASIQSSIESWHYFNVLHHQWIENDLRDCPVWSSFTSIWEIMSSIIVRFTVCFINIIERDFLPDISIVVYDSHCFLLYRKEPYRCH